MNRCFISASIPVFARTNILSILKSIPQSSRSLLIQSIIDISTQYNAMSSTPIDASALFLNATKSFPQLATGQGDLHEFVSECLVSIRRALRPHHRSINSEMIDAITPMFVTSKSRTRSSDLTMHEATERSVIELGLPDEQDDAGTALQIVALQDLVDKAFAPQVDEDISKKIDGFMWSQQLPSTGIAIFQINRTHYVDNYYNRTKVNIPLSVIINDVEYFLLCASLHHGGLEGGHFTVVCVDGHSAVYVNDEKVYENGDLSQVLIHPFVQRQVTLAVYEAQELVIPSGLYYKAKQNMNEGKVCQ